MKEKHFSFGDDLSKYHLLLVYNTEEIINYNYIFISIQISALLFSAEIGKSF